jgi:hypothetical protein
MLKKLILCLCLAVTAGAITGCHAGVHDDKGHGTDVNVG